MINFLYYDYIIGTILFLIERTFFRVNKTEKQEKQNELELKKSLYDLETQSNYIFGENRFARNFYDKIMKLKSNEWSRQFIIFIMFQIPVVNIYLFINSLKEKFVKHYNK